MKLGKVNIINLQIIYTYFKCNISNHQHNTSVKYHMYNVTLSEQHGPGQSPAPLTVTVCAPELGMLPGATTPPFVYTLRPEVGIRRFQFPLRAAAPTHMCRDDSNSRRRH